MAQQKKIKRTHYIVDKGIQYRYTGFLLFYISIFFLIAVAIVYFSGWRELIQKMANVYPQARLVAILNVVYVRFLIAFLLFLPIVVVSAILASHKIAGPLVRIKRALRQLTDGDYDLVVTLRKNDQLKDIAEDINKLAQSLKKKNVRE